MPYASQLDAAAARSAISRGDDLALERYLREGGSNPINSITAATATLQFGTNLYNRAAGIVGTLPFATGSGDAVRVIVITTLTGNGIVKVGRTADNMIGYLAIGTLTFGAVSHEAIGGGDDTITMSGTTSGGLQGSAIKCVDVAPNLWLVDGNLVASGTPITSLSNTV